MDEMFLFRDKLNHECYSMSTPLNLFESLLWPIISQSDQISKRGHYFINKTTEDLP